MDVRISVMFSEDRALDCSPIGNAAQARPLNFRPILPEVRVHRREKSVALSGSPNSSVVQLGQVWDFASNVSIFATSFKL